MKFPATHHHGTAIGAAALILLLHFLLVSCARHSGAPSAANIRVAYTSAPELGDIPSLMAHDLLSAEGYSVTTTFYASPELAASALARGDADFAIGSVRTFWAAAAKGSPVATIMEQAANDWVLVAREGITGCAQLSGMRIGYHSEGAVSKALADHYLQSQCAGTAMQAVMISDSENRASALLAGVIDAAPLMMTTVIHLNRVAPGRFRILADFGRDLPWLKTTAVHVNRHFAMSGAGAVRDYVRALLKVHRRIAADHSALVERASREGLMDEGSLLEAARHYADKAKWDLNGGLTERNLADSLAFYQKARKLPPGLRVDDVADLTHLTAVLDEIGRCNR